MSEKYKGLVTGATGFVGRHMVRELQTHGYDVVGTTKTELKQTENIVLCDVRDAYMTEKILRENSFDIVVFLAAQASVSRSFDLPELTKDVNVTGTKVFLEALRKLGERHPKKVIMVASSDVFGKPDLLPVTENTPFRPLNSYSESKVEEVKLIEYYRQKYNMDYIDILFPFNHTGPGQGPGFLPSDVTKRLLDIQFGENPDPVLLTGDLTAKRDFSDVRNIVRAYRLIAEKDIKGDNYLLSSGKSVPLAWVVDTLMNMCKVEVKWGLDSRFNRPSDILDLYGKPTKIKKLIDYPEAIPLSKTLADLYKAAEEERTKNQSTVKIG